MWNPSRTWRAPPARQTDLADRCSIIATGSSNDTWHAAWTGSWCRGSSAEQAAGVVAAVRYYSPIATDKIIVVQKETRRALETLDAGVAGIDVLFLGPVDLAKSLGFAGDFRCAEMQRVLREAVARIDRHGGVPGILVDRDNAAAWVRAGARFLYEHADSFLAAGAESFVASIDGVKAGGSANA